MILNKALNEPVPMIITRVPPQRQRDAGRSARRLQPFGLQLGFAEIVGQPLIDE
jgi:hypothetical protein